jgi:WD40 repeat protein
VASRHVCRIFDLVEADGKELVTMEYVDGTTLVGALRERGPLDLGEASEIASQFLAGLEAIHGAGLVHRDIKPGNVMITRTGRVVLMDFGLAKPVTDDQEHSIMGTRPYMAPEQLQGGSLDARTDIFAAGVLLAEMISVGGSSEQTTREALWAGVREEPPRLPQSPWRTVLLRAIAKDPGSRYPSAQALTRALEEITLRVQGANDRRPYPGLASFTEADTEFFFGREVEVEQMWRRLGWPHLQAIIGPSGAGKSSFLHAGLIPTLPEGWRCFVCTPGSTPMMALAQALAPELSGDPEAVRLLPRSEDPDVLVELIGRLRKRHEQALLIVDQFEELFTLSRPEVQARFAELLGRLALEADVHVLLSMRDDFLFHCHAHPPLAPIYSELTPLGPPTGQALRRALVQPALKCGYRFEEEALVDEMLAVVQVERGALPLLAFAVARLWEKRDREAGLLTRAAYREIGGVAGALAQHAEATLERIGTEQQPLMREMFRNLVTAQGTRAAREWEELLSVFPDRERAEAVLRALVDARLLTTYQVQEGEGDEARRYQRVEIIHESLLAAWPRLVRWQTQDADGAQLRDQLRQAAQLWQERGRPADLLWMGTSYREFRVWRERYPGGLSATEEAFGRAMVARAERRRRQVRMTVAGGFAALLGIVAVIGTLWVRAADHARRADASRLFAFGQLQIDTNPTLALAFAIASLERADNPEVRRFALDALGRQPLVYDEVGSASGPFIEFSPDGRWLAAGEHFTGKALLISSEGGTPRVLQTPGKHVIVKFGEGSDMLLTGTWMGSNAVQVWSVPDGRLIRTLEYGSADEWQWPLFLSGDRARLVTASVNSPLPYKRVRLLSWPPDGSQPVALGDLEDIDAPVVDRSGEWIAYIKGGDVYKRPLDGLGNAAPLLVGRHQGARVLAVEPSGRLLASGGAPGEIRVWATEGASESPIGRMAAEEEIHSLQFDPAGSLLASGDSSGKVRIWDLAGPSGLPPMELLGRRNFLQALAFHPSGHWLATYGEQQKVGLWPLNHQYPRILFRQKSRGSLLRGVVFAPDGTWIAASVEGARLHRWPLVRSGGEPIEVELTNDAYGLAVDPVGRYILAGTFKGVALVPLRGGRSKTLPGFREMVWAVAFSPDGRLAAAGGGVNDRLPADRFIRVWDLEAGTFRDLGTEQAIHSLSFLPDGRLLFVSGPTDGQKSLYRWTIRAAGAELLKEDVGTGYIFDLSPDRTHLLASTPEGALLHDLHDGSARLLASGASNCRFNKGGTLIACGDRRGTVRVISLDGHAPHDLVGHLGEVNEVAISPDDRFIVSAGTDGTVRLWPMPEGKPLLPLPRERFVERLRSFTNLRTVLDDQSPDGWRLEHDPPNPGWKTFPAW